MIRALVSSCVEGVIKRLSALGLMEITDREYLQHYGFTSRPKAGAEVVLVADGNHIVAIASDDRRYRIGVESGEVALYDDQGQKVHLTRDGIVITTTKEVTISAPTVTLSAATKVTMTTPLLEVSGEIKAGLDITDHTTTTPKSMAGMRTKYNSHRHGNQMQLPPSSAGEEM